MEKQPAKRDHIFAAALEISDAAKRDVYLSKACAGDDALQREMESLLAAYHRAGAFLEEPATDAPWARESATHARYFVRTQSEQAGDLIGRYKLIEQIGEGGFGAVWLAEQDQPVKRRVALKILKLGMDTKQVVARFEAERQALALMDHPGIAKVFDAGATPTGRPYFVMELVHGRKITEYCDQNHLSTRERLELFIRICRAIQHAHQKGIIHRDIKPSNVLVTMQDGVAMPKVIDFGIAKATQQELTDKTVFTQWHQFLGTPAYTSPEQADLAAVDIDTRSDIYSLGVLLYELLTGVTPFDSRELMQLGFDAIRRTVREKEPTRPSTKLRTLTQQELAIAAKHRGADGPKLVSLLRGDLDWITMKCLEKDRTRRYETANGLAREIERYLRNEPIVARPPSQIYRLGKTVRRNLLAVALGSAIALALIIGFAVSLWLLGREKEAHQEARDAKQKAETRLWEAYLSNARESRYSERPGRRFEGLEAVANAARLAASMSNDARLQLRNAAIPLLTLTDMRTGKPLLEESQLRAVYAEDESHSRYAQVDPSGNIVIRRFSDDTLLSSLPGFGFHAAVLRFSSDNNYLAVKYDPPSAPATSDPAAINHIVRVWNINERRAELSLTNVLGNRGGAFDFHPSQPQWAIGHGNGTIAAYGLPRGEAVKTFFAGIAPAELAYSPDGSSLAVISESESVITILNSSDATIRRITNSTVVYGIAWHPNGELLAAAGEDGRVYLWSARENVLRNVFSAHAAQAVRVAFSCDGGWMASSGWDSQVCVWDPITAELLCRAPGKMWRLTAGPNGGWVGFRLENGRQHALELATVRVCRTLIPRTPTKVYDATFSPDGFILAAGTDDGTAVWDVTRRIEAARLGSHRVHVVRFADEGRQLFASGEVAECWPVTATGDTSAASFGPARTFTNTRHISSLCLVPHSRKLAIVHHETDEILDLDNASQTIQLTAAGGAVSASPDGKWLTTGTWHNLDVAVWHTATWQTVTNLRIGTSARAFFSPDGRWLVGGSHGQFVQWETGSWRVRRQFSGQPDLGSVYMAFSPDSQLLAIRKSGTEVQIVSLEDGHEIITLPGKSPFPLCFSPDGTLLAVAEEQTRVRLWDLRAVRQELAKMNLDWDLPPYAPAPKTNSPPVRIKVITN